MQDQMLKPDRSRRYGIVALIFLVLVVLSLSSRRLFYPYFMDEIWVVRDVRSGTLNITPPLLFGLLRFIHLTFRYDGEWLMRLPSLLACVLSAVLLPAASIIRKWSARDTAVAWMTGVLLALSSPVYFYGTIVKIYALDVLLSVIAMALWIDAAYVKNRIAGWYRYSVFAVLYVTTTHTGVFVVAALAAVSVWRWFFSDPRSVREVKVILWVHVFLAAAFAIAYLRWLRVHVSMSTSIDPSGFAHFWSVSFWDGSLAFLIQRSRQWFGHQFNLVRGAWWVVGVNMAYWIVGRVARRQWADLSWSLLAFVPLGLVLTASRFGLYPYGEVRLMLFAAPFFFAMFARAITDNYYAGLWSKRIVTVVASAFLALYAMQGIVQDPFARTFMDYADDRPLHALLRESGGATAIPVFACPLERIVLSWYFDPQGIAVEPLAMSVAADWDRAWFVVDERSNEDWRLFSQIRNGQHVEELVTFAPRRGRHAALLRRRKVEPKQFGSELRYRAFE